MRRLSTHSPDPDRQSCHYKRISAEVRCRCRPTTCTPGTPGRPRSNAFNRRGNRSSVVDQQGSFGEGFKVTIRATLFGPIGKDWVAQVFDVEPGRQFRDRQLAGPFAEWTHTHAMIPDGTDTSFLDDSIEYRLPLGAVGQFFGSGTVRDRLGRMFAYRHALTASDLRRHQPYRDRPRRTVAVTGSTGLVGADLCLFLAAGGHKVLRLRRSEPKPTTVDDGTTAARWDMTGPIDPELLAGVDAVVHLAGDPIAEGRWSDEKKASIRDSRVGPTRQLAEAAAAAGVKTFVCASATGVYGDRGDEVLTEDSDTGAGFLADVVREWEAACDPARAAGVRVVNLRIGVVLSPHGGCSGEAVARVPGRRRGRPRGRRRSGSVGSGSAILIGVIHHALMTDDLAGPVNAVAPEVVTNREFGRVLARVLSRPYVLTMPAPALRVMFGELADAALLASQRVRPARLEADGFAFDHPSLEEALRFLLGK